MKKIIILLLLILVISGCSTVVKKQELEEQKSILDRYAGLKNLELQGSIKTDFGGTSNSASFKIIMASADSISITIYGPFGIVGGKMWATPDYFCFYDIFNNELIEGSPKSENMQKVLSVPLSYYDIVYLLRCELPTDPSQFTEGRNEDESLNLTFNNNQNPMFNESTYLSKRNKKMTSYHRRYKNNNREIMSVTYDNFEQFAKYILSKSIKFKFPSALGSVEIELSDVKINPEIEKPFQFSIPNNIHRNKL